ncbi:MAG: DUF1819 family protein [Paludibacter sp.]|nr:DUF1819 family protein [Paludibacter sp.]
MIINTDLNILGGLSDWNLIKLFMNESINALNQDGGHRSYTAIKTDKSVQRFEKAITGTLLNFKNKEFEHIFRTMISSESISNDSLFLIFLNASNNNDLLSYLNENVYFPALYSGRVGIKTTEATACLVDLKQSEPDLQKWADSTIEITASKYLTLLKKFNLMEGSLNKTIAHTYLNDKMFVIFIYWLLTIEQKPNILESPWLKYCFLEKTSFLERIMQKKFSKFYNLNFNGEKMKIEPIISYQNIYDELTKS